MSHLRLAFLFDCFVRRTINPAERAELMDLIDDPANDLEVRALIGRVIEEPGEEIAMPGEAAREILETILTTQVPAPQTETPEIPAVRRPIRWWRVAAAA